MNGMDGMNEDADDFMDADDSVCEVPSSPREFPAELTDADTDDAGTDEARRYEEPINDDADYF